MVTHLSREWWIVALRGVISILFGIVAFVYPGITLFALVIFFGAYLLIDGIVALVQAIRFRHDRERWPALLLEAVLGIVLGAISLIYPGIAALAWLYTIAAWAIVTGILEIALAIRLRKEIQGEFWIALTGVASIALGIGLAFLPLAGLLVWVWLIGAYAIAVGIFLIALAIRLRREGSTASPSGLAAGGVR
ncbi:MAG TPA: HdeD family acid-resistance protein [Candidatus Elarobacter sp.]|jgi:uncharacterized membrane protein HdeD (DUF308 family)|nr:HdeD family acid-resistance protein [Candidatus Elarobacter sp.]